MILHGFGLFHAIFLKVTSWYPSYTSFYYIDTDEIPGFLLLLKNHIFTARSEDTMFIFHVWGYWCGQGYQHNRSFATCDHVVQNPPCCWVHIWTQQIDLAPNVWLHSSVGRASHRYRGGHGFKFRWSLDVFQASSFQLLKLGNLLRWSFFTFIRTTGQDQKLQGSYSFNLRCAIWISYISIIYIYGFNLLLVGLWKQAICSVSYIGSWL